MIGEAASDIATVPETHAATENLQEVLKVESIAKFRHELEMQIFIDGLPKSEWRNAYNKALQKYPEVTDYKPILDLAMHKAELQNDFINYEWRQFQPEIDPTIQTDPRLEKAPPESSAQIFEYMFGSPPQDRVEAIKGQITVRFMVGTEDFKKLSQAKDDQHVPGAVALPTTGGYTAIVHRADADEFDLQFQVHHELEHGKYRILKEVSRQLAIFPESLDLPPNLQSLLRKRAGHDSEIDHMTKNEILAYFSPLTVKPADMDMKTFSFNIEGFANEDVKDALLDENGLYLPAYQQRYEPVNENFREEQTRRVTQSVDAFVNLSKMYHQTEPDFYSTKLAGYVLSQFPLRSWPAVVRLLEQKHRVELPQAA